MWYIKEQCHFTCLTCKGPNYNDCLSCDKTRHLKRDNICRCIDGYIEPELEE